MKIRVRGWRVALVVVRAVTTFTTDEDGFTATYELLQGGVGLSGSASLYGIVSNANTISEMGATFYAVNVGIDIPEGISGEFFWSPDWSVIGFAGGPGFGLGGDLSVWTQETKTLTLPSLSSWLGSADAVSHLILQLGWTRAFSWTGRTGVA